jgi:hypothetical protein
MSDAAPLTMEHISAPRSRRKADVRNENDGTSGKARAIGPETGRDGDIVAHERCRPSGTGRRGQILSATPESEWDAIAATEVLLRGRG